MVRLRKGIAEYAQQWHRAEMLGDGVAMKRQQRNSIGRQRTALLREGAAMKRKAAESIWTELQRKRRAKH